ncbi:DUF5134 domain-containing protein [Pseudonocardia sp. TRM90224]|uniref:DUF5134 domain-containing protein n=1 Tax=Pseudonocardia sp. TRM90224 TaxID=2812678 RepID=UPI001E517162|nr:DUF5134 domain-containing protein [Pseudonocardia sp. TRM90224]
MQIVSVLLAVGCLGLGLLHILRMVLRRADVVEEASHAAMAFGMAAMFSPFGDPVPVPVWVAVFAVSLGWFGTLAVAARSLAGEMGHHVLGSAAMLFMLFAGHGPTPGAGALQAGHGSHGGGGAGGLGVASVVAIVLAGYFAWHGLRCTDRIRPEPALLAVAPDAGPGAVALRLPTVCAPRTAAVAHLTMAVAMAVMLLAMV